MALSKCIDSADSVRQECLDKIIELDDDLSDANEEIKYLNEELQYVQSFIRKVNDVKSNMPYHSIKSIIILLLTILEKGKPNHTYVLHKSPVFIYGVINKRHKEYFERVPIDKKINPIADFIEEVMINDKNNLTVDTIRDFDKLKSLSCKLEIKGATIRNINDSKPEENTDRRIILSPMSECSESSTIYILVKNNGDFTYDITNVLESYTPPDAEYLEKNTISISLL